MLEVHSSPGQTPWRLEIPLTQHWRALQDLVEEVDPDLIAGLRDVGIDFDATEAAPEVVIVAVMTQPAANNDHPPLMASLTILDTPRPPGLPPIAGASQEPAVSRDEYQIEWPGEVGSVRFHRATYVLATPDDERAIVLTFATPNLPLAESMDALFDSIVGRARFFVEKEPAPA